MWVLFVILAIIIIIGGLLILLRTANIPKLPKDFKSAPYEDDDSNW